MIEDKNLIRKIALFLDPYELIDFIICNKMIYNALNCKEFWIMKNLYDHDDERYHEREEFLYRLTLLNEERATVKEYRDLYFYYHSLPVYLEFRIKQVPIFYEESFSMGVQIRLPFRYLSLEEYVLSSNFNDHFKKFCEYCSVSKYNFDYESDYDTDFDSEEFREYIEQKKVEEEKKKEFEVKPQQDEPNEEETKEPVEKHLIEQEEELDNDFEILYESSGYEVEDKYVPEGHIPFLIRMYTPTLPLNDLHIQSYFYECFPEFAEFEIYKC